jgi:hypothetical protein
MSGALQKAWIWFVFASSYAAFVILDLPRPRYLPVEGRVVLEVPPGAIVMSWYGAFLMAALAAVLAWVLPMVRILGPVSPERERRWLSALLAGVLLSGLVLAAYELRPL